MMTLKAGEKEYKIRYGYNSFCDTDLLERTEEIMKFLSKEEENTIQEVRKLFVTVRELLYYGFMKLNPVEKVSDVGNILDDYLDCVENGENRGLKELFEMLTSELFNEGFLAGLTSGEPTQETGGQAIEAVK